MSRRLEHPAGAPFDLDLLPALSDAYARPRRHARENAVAGPGRAAWSRRRNSTSAPSPSSRSARPWPSSTACSRAFSRPWPQHAGRAPAAGAVRSRRHRRPRRHAGGGQIHAASSDMAAMLIGVYQGLFASAVELGIADDTRAEAFKTECRGRCRRPLLLPDPDPDRRVEARNVTTSAACRMRSVFSLRAIGLPPI